MSTTFLTAADVPGGLDIPTSLDFDPNGNLVIADSGMRRLIEVSPSKDVNVLTSDLGFDYLQVQLAIHPISGDKFIRADADSILKIDYSGNVTTLATGFTDVFGLAFGPSTSGKGISLFAVDAGSTLTVIDGDVIYEIVPEPASVMMIAAGGILLLQRRRCSMRSSFIGSVKPSRL